MFIDLFVPPVLEKHSKDYRTSRLIIMVDLMLICSAAFLGPFFWWIGFEEGAYIMLYTIANALIFLALMYKTADFLLCGNFFSLQSWLVFSALIISSGGTDSPFFMWLLSIPPIAIFYMRSKYSFLWCFLTVATAVLIVIAHSFFGAFPQNIDAVYRPYIVLFNYSALLTLFVLVVKTFKDNYKRVNIKLSKANEQLKRSNSDLERFAFIASHDLKSPLRNIISFLGLFNRRYGAKMEAGPKEYLDIVKSNAMQMQTLIEDILEYSKTNSTTLKEEEIDLNRMIKLIISQLKTNPSYEKAELMIWDLPVVVGDLTRLQQLFQNLIENGLKYNESDFPTVAIKYMEEGENHYFIVEDNGIGIPEEYHERIFKMFERLHTREHYQGTGIGLSICLKNVEEYGGSIQIDSADWRGTQFHIRIPQNRLKAVNKVVHTQKNLIEDPQEVGV